jgi:ribosomal protein L9
VNQKRFYPRAADKRVSVILTEDLKGFGYLGEEKNVKMGHARNHLFPNKLAVYNTAANRAAYPLPPVSIITYVNDAIELLLQAELIEEREAKERKQVASRRLANVVVYMKRQLKPDGELHAPVTAENISEKLYEQHALVIPPSDIHLPDPIAKYGNHIVPVHFGGNELTLKLSLTRR